MNEIVACAGTVPGFVSARSEMNRVLFSPPALTVPGMVHVEASTGSPVDNTERNTAVRTVALRMARCPRPVMRKWAPDPLMTEPNKPHDSSPSPPGDVTRLLIAWNGGRQGPRAPHPAGVRGVAALGPVIPVGAQWELRCPLAPTDQRFRHRSRTLRAHVDGRVSPGDALQAAF